MKAILFSLVLLTLSLGAGAQTYKFAGDWYGKITTNSGQSLWVRIKIDNNNITQYFYDDDDKQWNPVSPVLARYSSNKNNLLYYWMNNSAIWSETQTYALSYVSDDQIYVVWSRQVNNIKEDADNNVWSLQGTGYLARR